MERWIRSHASQHQELLVTRVHSLTDDAKSVFPSVRFYTDGFFLNVLFISFRNMFHTNSIRHVSGIRRKPFCVCSHWTIGIVFNVTLITLEDTLDRHNVALQPQEVKHQQINIYIYKRSQSKNRSYHKYTSFMAKLAQQEVKFCSPVIWRQTNKQINVSWKAATWNLLTLHLKHGNNKKHFSLKTVYLKLKPTCVLRQVSRPLRPLRPDRAAICFSTVFMFLLLFVCCLSTFQWPAASGPPTGTLARRVPFPCQPPTRAPALIGSRTCCGDSWETEKTTCGEMCFLNEWRRKTPRSRPEASRRLEGIHL